MTCWLSKNCQNSISTKTRIETIPIRVHTLHKLCQNSISTKTRIETWWDVPSHSWKTGVKIQYPLKQGLKQAQFRVLPLELSQNSISTKTRIETPILSELPSWQDLVKIQYPLKQGLKLITEYVSLHINISSKFNIH